MSDPFLKAITRIDLANSDDPDKVLHDGKLIASEVLYSKRMTNWLNALYPESSEALHLAARAQHIRRWEIPRSSYPMDRAGYHQWRTALYAYHADLAEKILRESGYDEETIARVRSMLKKERLKADPETQALEDVICLVFLEFEFADFAPRYDDDKIIKILQRTWAKMSPVGHAAALKLQLPENARRLIKRALS